MRGKRIIITGASSGIGYELLKQLRNDNKIFAVSRNIEKIEESENVKAFSCDVSVAENVDRLFEEALVFLGRIDVFFANAGFAYYEKIEKTDWDHNLKIFETNVLSVLYSLQKLKEIKRGSEFTFIITASAMSYLAVPGYALYASTKFALKGFADAYRHELEKGQNLCLVYPVATLTEFFNTAHANEIPWPRQTADVVAKKIIKAVSRGKINIYPCFIFSIGLILNKIFPIFKLYHFIEGKKYKRKIENNLNLSTI
jgi:short-subunit dehydrogenase